MSELIVLESDPWVGLLTGKALGPYRLDHIIGGGNFSHVFEAVHQPTGERFAVKVLKPTADSVTRVDFETEGVLLQRLDAANGVISYIDGGVAELQVFDEAGVAGAAVPFPVSYIVMPLAAESVDRLIEDPYLRAAWSWIERLQTFRGIAKAIRQMHAHGIAHRDMKCANCLLMRGGSIRIRLTDLGRAKDMSLPRTRSVDEYLAGRGDVRFAPPEYLHLQGGDSSEDFLSADYYGLASLLAELATGQPLSALALGDVMTILTESVQDYRAGRRRDLSAMTLRYRSVIADVVMEMPSLIRDDATMLLTTLGHPVPSERLKPPPYSRDRHAPDGLSWVLRRADIMIHRLTIEQRQQRRAANGRTAD